MPRNKQSEFEAMTPDIDIVPDGQGGFTAQGGDTCNPHCWFLVRAYSDVVEEADASAKKTGLIPTPSQIKKEVHNRLKAWGVAE